jgi:preprotein translocase subunit SecB
VTEENKDARETGDSTQAGLAVQKIYLKDCSFEAPNTPAVFTHAVEPRFNINIDIEHSVLDKQEGLYNVVLPVTVKAETDSGTVFLIEVLQAGVFQINGVGDDIIDQVLEINCADILLPYARQTVSSLATSGGFPQLLINPVNFAVLYEQRHAGADS